MREAIIATVGIVLILAVAHAIDPGPPCREDAPDHITVKQGQTLWGIARTHYINEDPRRVIDEIREVNDLSSGIIQIGQELRLPQ